MSRQIDAHHARIAARHGVAARDCHVLCLLLSADPPTIREIGDALALKPSTLGSLLDRLEDRGLVRRRPHEDRRTSALHLTRRGREQAEALALELRKLDRRIQSMISKTELRSAFKLIHAVDLATEP